MKRTILTILLISIFPYYILAQMSLSDVDESEIKRLLKKHLKYTDPNPIWQEEADEINIFIDNLLSNNELENAKKDSLRTKAFELLYDNSTFIFEDAVDVRRMTKRKIMSYLAISLLSDEYRYMSFIDNARSCLYKLDKDLEKEKAIIDLVEVLMIMNDEIMSSKDKEERIKKLAKSIEKLKSDM